MPPEYVLPEIRNQTVTNGTGTTGGVLGQTLHWEIWVVLAGSLVFAVIACAVCWWCFMQRMFGKNGSADVDVDVEGGPKCSVHMSESGSKTASIRPEFVSLSYMRNQNDDFIAGKHMDGRDTNVAAVSSIPLHIVPPSSLPSPPRGAASERTVSLFRRISMSRKASTHYSQLEEENNNETQTQTQSEDCDNDETQIQTQSSDEGDMCEDDMFMCESPRVELSKKQSIRSDSEDDGDTCADLPGKGEHLAVKKPEYGHYGDKGKEMSCRTEGFLVCEAKKRAKKWPTIIIGEYVCLCACVLV
jgi:hypothetical protein